MKQKRNVRHPMALQAEVKKQLAAEGKLDEHGNRIHKGGKPKPPPPPPASGPSNMLRTGATEVRAPIGGSASSVPSSGTAALSPREKLEALPDAEIVSKADTLGLNKEGATRDDLINSLLEAGAEG